jgi:endonuclease YncB( thermonuclease family)
MNKGFRVLSLLLLLAVTAGVFAACGDTGSAVSDDPQPPQGPSDGGDPASDVQKTDYAADLKLNMQSFTKKLEVTVKNYVDGDTVHFNVPTEEMPGGVLKGRFLAINTPESTGKSSLMARLHRILPKKH